MVKREKKRNSERERERVRERKRERERVRERERERAGSSCTLYNGDTTMAATPARSEPPNPSLIRVPSESLPSRFRVPSESLGRGRRLRVFGRGRSPGTRGRSRPATTSRVRVVSESRPSLLRVACVLSWPSLTAAAPVPAGLDPPCPDSMPGRTRGLTVGGEERGREGGGEKGVTLIRRRGRKSRRDGFLGVGGRRRAAGASQSFPGPY